jgi:predicted flap endonuclease-1-like 5' DNA nuclease
VAPGAAPQGSCRGDVSEQAWVVGLITGLCLWAAVGCWRSPSVAEGAKATGNPQALPSTVDPNTAPWWELTVLPRIGEVTAKKIVAYRVAAASSRSEVSPVFRRAADLEQVSGIGPKTVRRIEPYLRFPSAEPPEAP